MDDSYSELTMDASSNFPCGHPCTAENMRVSKGKNKGCKACHRESQKRRYHADPSRHQAAARAYHEAHREERAAYYAEWRAVNAEKKRAYDAAYAKANAEHRLEYARQWREQNRDKVRAYFREVHRTRRLGLDDPETRDWADLIRNDPCSYCGAPGGEVDHIEPSVRGGENHWTNYAPACRSCNARKHAKPLLKFLLDQRAS